MSDGLTQFQLSYEISPIILVGGIAQNMPGSMQPIISLTQAQDFSGGVTGQSSDLSYNDFVAHFMPMAGGTLIEDEVGMYPFANQYVAANAIIVQPLRVSLMMIAPAPNEGGYPAKLTAFTSLQQTLSKHNIQGGTYTVATPSYIYTNCLLLALRDVSTLGETEQVQVRWQWDFVQPLITQAAAASAQSSLIQKITSGTQVSGDPPSYSGTQNAVGDSSSGVSPPLVPAGSNLAGTSAGQGLSTGLGSGPAPTDTQSGAPFG